MAVSDAGDVDNDGYDDVLVGAYGNDDGGSSAGAAYVVNGSSTGISDMSLSCADAQMLGETSSNYAGRSVASAGDINADGYDDVLVGSYYQSSGGYSYNGAAYLVLGSTSGISDMSLTDADAKLDGEATSDYAGYSLSTAGDVDGDGNADILVGAYANDSGGTSSGAAYLIFGF